MKTPRNRILDHSKKQRVRAHGKLSRTTTKAKTYGQSRIKALANLDFELEIPSKDF